MKADVWWVVGGALVVFLTVLGVLVDRYLCAVYWWPLVGTEWRKRRRPYPHQPGSPSYPPGSPLYDPDEEFCSDCQTLCTEDQPCSCCYVEREDALDDDDAWVERLHVINLDAHRDRPIHQLTHYEVEAVIRDLGVPEWVPQRYRTAA